MGKITSVDLSIQRSSFSAGSICSVNYSYLLENDDLEVENELGYMVWCELWGRDMIGDKLIGEDIYDSHSLTAEHRLRAKRSFPVNCEDLNARVGKDELYIKVKAESTLGIEIEATSKIIKDAF